MDPFTSIAIIYNPNSTGPSEAKARQLAHDLSEAGNDVEVRLIPTEYAGHATALAYDFSRQQKRPLIISSSGDGGYHEVINGSLRAQDEGASPVCAVLAAGNANDHSRAVVERPLSVLIAEGHVHNIDVLNTSIRSGSSVDKRYAHSYIGVGLTPKVAVELNRTNLNRIKEVFIVYRALKNLSLVEIDVNGSRLEIYSLVLANISKMAKVLTIADNALPDDGQMEVTVFRHRNKARLLMSLAKAALTGVRGKPTEMFEFTAIAEMVMQFDGEVHTLRARDVVTVSVAPGKLATLA